MPHSTPLITLIVAGFGLAFILGVLANKLRLSPIVGYLLAGVIIGPTTPGYIGDLEIAHELAEIGVILLMFGVGLHFSWNDLVRVKRIAVPGAICQIIIATLMGITLNYYTGWSFGSGIVFGLSLSVASTVVLIRSLQERHLLKNTQGQIAIGWLVVEDLAMVFVLVLLPTIADFLGEKGPNTAVGAPFIKSDIALILGVTLFKITAFIILMLLVGTRVIPWVLKVSVKTKSKELFRLAILAIALSVAYGAAKLFGVSFAIGAFFAGMILSESELSQRAAEESLPLREAFAVLFFVAMGMLLNPKIILIKPFLVLAAVMIIIFGKSLAAYLITIIFRYPHYTALTIAVSLAQIGEFSFILAEMGVKLDILSSQAQDVIIAAAIISILLNPIFFSIIGKFKPKKSKEIK